MLNAAANLPWASHCDCYGDHGSKLNEIHSDYNRNLLGNILVSDGRAAGPDQTQIEGTQFWLWVRVALASS
jgi:hypothetical protein